VVTRSHRELTSVTAGIWYFDGIRRRLCRNVLRFTGSDFTAWDAVVIER
jgi:hypothetical protein